MRVDAVNTYMSDVRWRHWSMSGRECRAGRRATVRYSVEGSRASERRLSMLQTMCHAFIAIAMAIDHRKSELFKDEGWSLFWKRRKEQTPMGGNSQNRPITAATASKPRRHSSSKGLHRFADYTTPRVCAARARVLGRALCGVCCFTLPWSHESVIASTHRSA